MNADELLAELRYLSALEPPRAPWPDPPPPGTTRSELDALEVEVLAYLRERDVARAEHGERARKAVKAYLYADSGIPYEWPTGWPTDWNVLNWCLDEVNDVDADYWVQRWRHDAEVSLGMYTGTIHERRRREHA